MKQILILFVSLLAACAATAQRLDQLPPITGAEIIAADDEVQVRDASATSPQNRRMKFAEFANIPGLFGGKEPALGNPSTDDQVLTSSSGGTRSWKPNNSIRRGIRFLEEFGKRAPGTQLTALALTPQIGNVWRANLLAPATPPIVSATGELVQNAASDMSGGSFAYMGATVNMSDKTAYEDDFRLSYETRHISSGLVNRQAKVTFTNASPTVITWANHGLQTCNPLKFSTLGTPPAGITAGTTYYAKPLTSNTLQISASQTLGVPGASVNTTSTGAGDQYATVQCFTKQDFTTIISQTQMLSTSGNGWQVTILPRYAIHLQTSRGGPVFTMNQVAGSVSLRNVAPTISPSYAPGPYSWNGSTITSVAIEGDWAWVTINGRTWVYTDPEISDCVGPSVDFVLEWGNSKGGAVCYEDDISLRRVWSSEELDLKLGYGIRSGAEDIIGNEESRIPGEIVKMFGQRTAPLTFGGVPAFDFRAILSGTWADGDFYARGGNLWLDGKVVSNLERTDSGGDVLGYGIMAINPDTLSVFPLASAAGNRTTLRSFTRLTNFQVGDAMEYKIMGQFTGTAAKRVDLTHSTYGGTIFDSNLPTISVTTASITNNTTALTLATTAGISTGWMITGTGIADNCRVTVLNGTDITLSSAYTGSTVSGTGSFTFGAAPLDSMVGPYTVTISRLRQAGTPAVYFTTLTSNGITIGPQRLASTLTTESASVDFRTTTTTAGAVTIDGAILPVSKVKLR